MKEVMFMLKIAICDDEKVYRNSAIGALTHIEEKLNKEFQIFTFSSGEDLCNNLHSNRYDVILLDIIMDGIDGIETAKKIHSMNVNSYIIFISSYDKRLKELFGFKTLAFLDKPLVVNELENAIVQVFNLIDREKENIFVYTSNKIQSFVYLKDIVFIESKGRKLEINTSNETININETLKNTWDKLSSNSNFLMLNRSYIVNLKYARMTNSTTFYINSHNISITVGRTMKEDVTNRYLKFIRSVEIC